MSMEGKGKDEAPVSRTEEKTYPLAWNVSNGALERMNWDQVEVLSYAGLEQSKDAERFGAFLLKGWKERMDNERHIRWAMFDVYNQRGSYCSSRDCWGWRQRRTCQLLVI